MEIQRTMPPARRPSCPPPVARDRSDGWLEARAALFAIRAEAVRAVLAATAGCLRLGADGKVRSQ